MNTRFRVARNARIAIVVGILALVLSGGVRADEPSRAGLVVVYAPDDVHTSCVTFDAAEVTGLELLQRAGLAVIQAGTTGVGESVCKIEGVGCDFPGEHCFCQCLSTPCTFWSYWYWQDGDWMFSQRGAASRRLSDGAVEAWVWGDGQTRPPAIDVADEGRPFADEGRPFASICGSPPQLSSPASQDGYPGPDDTTQPQPTTDPGPYPGPGDGQEEPTPEPEPSATPEPSPREAEAPSETPTPMEQTATPGPDTTATATPTPSATPTASPTATPATPSPTPGPSATPTDDGMAAAIATAVARNRAAPTDHRGGSGVGSYVAFALLALVLVALIVYAILLRRQRAREVAE